MKGTTKQNKKSDQIEKFKRDTQGMTGAQKLEYLMMNDKDKDKYVESIRSQNRTISKEEGDSKKENHIHVKVIKEGQICVFVLNMRGKPMMPTSPGKARMLLKRGKAKVVQRDPFTIQLEYPTGENKQHIKLGLDPGYKNVGFSTTTEKRELISGEVILRNDVSEKITEKKMYRTNRRGRIPAYREPGFENRYVPKGWLAPSIQHKLDTYVRLVEKFDKILPITGITIETSPFDMQKMMNSEISGIEYQQGELQGYEVKEYLLEKWGRKCAYCKIENVPFEAEHIIPTSRGGTNRVSNLTIACHECNQKKGNLTAAEFGHPEVQIMAKKSLKSAAFMNVVRSRLVDNIKENFPQYQCNSTYGYITKYNRIRLGLDKTHANDAFVIASGVEQIRSKPYSVEQIRRNNRSLQLNRKGFKPSIRKKRYKYSPGDLVKRRSSFQTTGWGDKIDKKDRSMIYTVKGVFNYGEYIRLANPISDEKDIDVLIEDVKILKYGSGLLFQLADKQKKDNIEKKDKVAKLSKKEKKIIDMKGQKLIDDAWN